MTKNEPLRDTLRFMAAELDAVKDRFQEENDNTGHARTQSIQIWDVLFHR